MRKIMGKVALVSILLVVLTATVAFAVTRFDGTNGNDQLNGTSGDDAIYGFGGDDLLQGWAGNDKLAGMDGNETGSGKGIYGGPGNDLVFGDMGKDYLLDGRGQDEVNGGPGDDVIISAQDSTRDAISCGSGYDRVEYRESIDSIHSDCERVLWPSASGPAPPPYATPR